MILRIFIFYVFALSAYFVLAKNGFREPRLAPARIDILWSAAPNLLVHMGDRYLAANINYLRSLMVAFDDPALIDARVYLQTQVTQYNPKHEDNYYVAASTFPWEDRVDVAQSVLLASASARYWDSMPYFLMALNAANLQNDLTHAASYVAKAAEIESGPNKAYFNYLAANFYRKSDNLIGALAHLELLAEGSSSPKLEAVMKKRVERIKKLIDLRHLALDYLLRYGRPIQRLTDLLEAGMLSELPEDPLGIGFGVSAVGTPDFLERLNAGN